MDFLAANLNSWDKKGADAKRGVDEIFQDARLVANSRTKLGPPRSRRPGFPVGEQNAVTGSRGQYQLDGDKEAELQAEVGVLVERMQSTRYTGRLSELDVDALLEDALEEGEPGAGFSQHMSVAMWEEKLAAENQRKQHLQQCQKQPCRKSARIHSGDTGLQVERSASCSALRHTPQKPLPEVNLKPKSKTVQEDIEQLLGPPPGPRGSKMDSRGESIPPRKEWNSCSSLVMRTRGSEILPSTKVSLSNFSMPMPLKISSDSDYGSPSDTSPASFGSCAMNTSGASSLERIGSRPYMLPPLHLHPSRAPGAGAQDSPKSCSSTPASTKTAGQAHSRPWEHQGSMLSRHGRSQSHSGGLLAPLNSPGGVASLERSTSHVLRESSMLSGVGSLEPSSSRVLNLKASGVSLAPMGGLMTANSLHRNARQPRLSWGQGA